MSDTSFQSHDALPSTRDFLYVVFKYIAPIAIILIGTVTLALVYNISATPMYQAEGRVLVKLGRQQLSALDPLSGDTYNVLFQERGQNINNEIEIFKGPFLTHVVFAQLKDRLATDDDLEDPSLWSRISSTLGRIGGSATEILRKPLYLSGLARRMGDDERLAQAFQNSLRTEFVEDSDIIRVEFVWPDPEFAAFAVNAYIEAYLKRNIDVHSFDGSRDFYVGQITQLERLLGAVESDLEEFRIERGIVNLEVQKDLLLREISAMRRELVGVDREIKVSRSIKESSARIAGDGVKWPGTPRGDIMGDTSVLDSAYFSLVTERSGLSGKFMPSTREIQDIDRQKGTLQEEKLGGIVVALEIELESLQAQRETLFEALRSAELELADLNSGARRLSALERERRIVEETYLLYQSKGEELRLLQDLDSQKISSVKVLSPATPPLLPAYPRTTLILALSVFLGGFGSFTYVMVAEFFNHTFRGEREVRRLLGVPLFATVSAGGIQDNSPDGSNDVPRPAR